LSSDKKTLAASVGQVPGRIGIGVLLLLCCCCRIAECPHLQQIGNSDDLPFRCKLARSFALDRLHRPGQTRETSARRA
jgi:hypothetical protein